MRDFEWSIFYTFHNQKSKHNIPLLILLNA